MLQIEQNIGSFAVSDREAGFKHDAIDDAGIVQSGAAALIAARLLIRSSRPSTAGR